MLYIPAVLMTGRMSSLLINILLCFLLWIPGIIHAIIVVKDHHDDRRLVRKQRKS